MFVPAVSSAESVASHCTVREQTWFTCPAGAKIVSVCATRGPSGDVRSVQYRYGPAAAAEISYPRAGTDWRAATRAGVLTFSGGGGAYLTFTRPPYRYVVYTAIGRGWGEKAGVVVERSGRRIASLPCTAKETSKLGPDVFGEAGIAEDAAGFDLP
jgi:hypothetical protein